MNHHHYCRVSGRTRSHLLYDKVCGVSRSRLRPNKSHTGYQGVALIVVRLLYNPLAGRPQILGSPLPSQVLQNGIPAERKLFGQHHRTLGFRLGNLETRIGQRLLACFIVVGLPLRPHERSLGVRSRPVTNFTEKVPLGYNPAF